MYEDTWYSFVPPDPKLQKEDSLLVKSAHRKRESLLKQPNEADHGIQSQENPLISLFEDPPAVKGPPEATVARRAKSYSDFYHVVRAQLTKDCKRMKQEYRETGTGTKTVNSDLKSESYYEKYEDDLLDASHEEFQLYRDQLALSERHLDGLLEDTTVALDLLSNLSESFKSVEGQTTSFQAQCEDPLEEQKRLKTLFDEVGTHMRFYSYLEPITRRLNAPGASSMIGDEGFVETLSNLDACIMFMMQHQQHREADVYLARYKSLHERTLNLFHIKFVKLVQGEKEKSKRNCNSSEKLTITNLFLHLAPESNGDLALLGNTMEYIKRLLTESEVDEMLSVDEKTIKGVGDLYKNSEWTFVNDTTGPNLSRSPDRDHLAKYSEAFGMLIKEYVDVRSDLTPNLMHRFITELDKTYGSDEYSGTYAHDLIGAILEISGFECSKFMMIFAGEKENRRQHPGVVRLVVRHSDQFLKFINLLSIPGLDKLFQKLKKTTISEEVNLAAWIKGQDSANDEISDDEDNDSGGWASRFDNWKRLVINEMMRSMESHIIDRLRAAALKAIQNYAPNTDDMAPHANAKTPVKTTVKTDDDEYSEVGAGASARAENLLGAGILNAYPPVISAVQLFVVFNDLFYDGKMDNQAKEMAYTIIHGTCEAISRAAKQINARYSSIDSSIFSIKNLVLTKNVVLALEISGSHRASILDFSSIWTTFSDLRSRGGFLDISSYYNMVVNGTLLPKVVETVQDARTELDGLLRQEITKFREECALKLWDRARKSPQKDHWVVKEQLIAKLKVMFPAESQLRESLWQAVEELVENWKTGS